MVMANDQPVTDFTLKAQLSGPGFQRNISEPNLIQGPGFRIEYPIRPPRGTSEIRLAAEKKGYFSSLPTAPQRITC
jgi:hypothetical protein